MTPISERTQAQIDKAFEYHAPNPENVLDLVQIRQDAKRFAITIAERCPESRELSIALTKLEEVVMFANAAIVRNRPGT